MRIVTIIGARPQFIKSAPVSRALAAARIGEILVHTGQHYDAVMSDVFFVELSLRKPDYHLGIGSGSHGQQTGRMLEAIEAVLAIEQPAYALVYGDTNSTLAGALAAAKLHIPVAHIEAGLRSFNRRMPEEINRVATDHLSGLLFAPTTTAIQNLAREGIEGSVHLVGDVMFDAALMFRERLGNPRQRLVQFGLDDGAYALVTIHRAENTDDPQRLLTIINGLELVAAERPVVWPVHPRTRRAMALAEIAPRRVLLRDPVGYLDMLALQSGAAVIVTDSGGIQKEAFFAEVPCVTLRDETEWVELVDTGWNRLCSPADPDEIAAAILQAIGGRGQAAELYGGGNAATRIARIISR